ncbi:ribose-phosphate diphosphokinase [Thermoproteota archaeon]
MSTNYLSHLKLIPGSSHPHLADEIAAILGIELGKVKLSKFSCGETYAHIEESIRGNEIYILQTITETVNDDYMELFLLMDALRRASAKAIYVIIPHFGYARQDKKSAPREPISSRVIADLLTTVGLDRLITVDLHAQQIQGFFNKPVDHLTALPLFIDYFSNKKLENLVIVAPDAGRAKYAKKVSDKLNADLAILHKTRPSHNRSEITNIIGDVNEKTVLLVDDMIDTAGTITSGLEVLRKNGCNKDIYLAATHAVLSGPAVERLSNAGFKEVVVTNTINISKAKQFPGLKILSIGPMLAEVIKRNYEKRSIAPLFG